MRGWCALVRLCCACPARLCVLCACTARLIAVFVAVLMLLLLLLRLVQAMQQLFRMQGNSRHQVECRHYSYARALPAPTKEPASCVDKAHSPRLAIKLYSPLIPDHQPVTILLIFPCSLRGSSLRISNSQAAKRPLTTSQPARAVLHSPDCTAPALSPNKVLLSLGLPPGTAAALPLVAA